MNSQMKGVGRDKRRKRWDFTSLELEQRWGWACENVE